MKTLAIKLARDLWRLRTQCLTIAIVVGCGIASLVAALSASASVAASRDAFYADARFADLFVHLVRAPRHVLERIRELPGVAAVEGRTVGDFRLVLEASSEPVVVRFVSRGPHGGLNQVQIEEGRDVDPASDDEVLLSRSFADTWNLKPGATVSAVIEGRLARLRVVGIAISPEFVWASSPRTGLPDPWHFGVAWMDERALADAMGMVGAFDDAVIQLTAGADAEETIRRVDALLEPYGGLGAVGRGDQPSARLVDRKIAQLGKMARSVPLMFVGIACFLLHVLLSRIVSAQREQIATLKALGYRTRDLTIHYLEFALCVCLLGGVFGWILGALAAHGILSVYARYFRFPAFLFRFDAASVLAATAAAVAAGIAGTYFAVRRAVAIPPAEAMRPEAPPSYRPTLFDALYAWLPPVARMVLRDAARRPVRLVLSATSIALATGIVLSGNVMTDSLDAVLRLQFEVAHREDIAVTLDGSRPWRAVLDAAHVPGVERAEGERQVPVRLRAENRERTTAILGVDPAETLHTLLAADQRPLAVPAAGLALSRPLAQELAVGVGDPLDVEVLEGERRTVRLPVAAVVDDLMGLSAYMDATALSRLMDETRRANVVLLAVDAEALDDVTRRLEALPAVAAISRPSVDRGLVRAEVGDVFVALEVILALFAAAIAVGVVYNNARIALELRSRDLATMRILGFTRRELAFVLLGEQAIQLVLGVPLGLVVGRAMGGSSLASIDRELLRVPVAVTQASYFEAACVVLLAAVACAWIVRRHADRLDLVAVLKARD